MKNWVNRNYKTLIISAFLIPIITVAIVSISHVTTWYGISNPLTWAIYLSIGIEIAALSALAAISANMGSKVYFPFGVVTLIQFIGNIYFAYQYIDIDGEQFKDWVELTSSTLEFIGIDPTDVIGHKRFLSLFAGGMLPIISLSFLHMLVKFTQEKSKNQQQEESKNTIDSKELVSEISRVRLSEDELFNLENILLKKQQQEQEVVEKKKNEEDQPFTNYINKEEVSLPLNKIVSNDLRPNTQGDNESSDIEDWEAYNKLMDLQHNNPIDNSVTITEPSTPPNNASEMMLSTDDDVIKSIPSDDEKSEFDLLTDTQPVVIEELPENQPIPDTSNPALIETEEIVIEEEKKKN